MAASSLAQKTELFCQKTYKLMSAMFCLHLTSECPFVSLQTLLLNAGVMALPERQQTADGYEYQPLGSGFSAVPPKNAAEQPRNHR